MPHSLDASLTVFTRSTVQTNNMISPHTPPSFPLVHSFCAYWTEAYSEMASKHQKSKSTKIFPAGCACVVVCVHPRLCKTSQRHTLVSGQAPREIPDLFRNSLYPAFFFSTLKEVGLGLSPNSCSESRTQICCGFSSPVRSQSF